MPCPRRRAARGRGEELSGGRNKPSILAGAFEALLGAIYHDGGYQPARRAIERYFSVDVTAGTLGQQDYKTRLQEISQMLYRVPPVYRIVSEAGPDHEKFFTTEISIDGKVLGKGAGPSKKKSEQEGLLHYGKCRSYWECYKVDETQCSG